MIGVGLGLIVSAIVERINKRRKTPGIPVEKLAEMANRLDPGPEPIAKVPGRCYAVEARRLDHPMIVLVVVSTTTLAKVAFDQMIESCLGSPTFMVRVVQLDDVKSVESANPAVIKGEVMALAQNGY